MRPDFADLMGPAPDYEYEEAANDETTAIDERDVYGFVDHMDRKLDATVGWNPEKRIAEWVSIWDANGERVSVDLDTKDAIVRRALS